MKKSLQQLLKIAAKFQYKYGQAQNLQHIIQSAARYGESSRNGIMNFPLQLEKDQAELRFNVTISGGVMGGLNAEVLNLVVKPLNVAAKYSKLPDQINNYLNRHLAGFPHIQPGIFDLKYSGKTNEDID